MRYILHLILVLIVSLCVGCGKEQGKENSIESITRAGAQDSIFHQLTNLTPGAFTDSVVVDSLAFLILPVQASCPSCRNKTIDSIVKYQDVLPPRHYIIISADGGYKSINGYFRERDTVLPNIEARLFLDTTNQAGKYGLYKLKPTMYYTYNGKAYKKVASLPSTIREDLHEFFSGRRQTKEKS